MFFHGFQQKKKYITNCEGITPWKATARFLIKKMESMLVSPLSLLKGMKKQSWQHMTDYSSWMSGTRSTRDRKKWMHWPFYLIHISKRKKKKKQPTLL